MKKFATILAAVALLALGTAAFAADTATVTVSATVVGSCAFVGGPNPGVTLPFGSITTPVAAPVAATPASVSVICSPGTAWTITDDDGLNELAANQNRMVDGAGHFLLYSFGYAPAAGSGTGAAQPVSITGSLAAADLNAAFVGVYGDTVVLTLAP